MEDGGGAGERGWTGEETGDTWRLWEREGELRRGGVQGNSEKEASLLEVLLRNLFCVVVPLSEKDDGFGGEFEDCREAISKYFFCVPLV